MPIKLSDTQLVILSTAAQREDRCLVARKSLNGAAAQKVATRLLAAGLVKEIRAKPRMAVWRRDEQAGQSFALKLTAAGLKAIAVDDEVDAEDAAAEASNPDSQVEPDEAAALAAGEEAPHCPAASRSAGPALGAAAPRAGSKLAEVVGLLGREGGASLDELIAATAWLPHTTRAALTSLRQRGYAIERRREDDATRYWLAACGIDAVRGADGSGGIEDANGGGEVARGGARARPTEAA